MKVIKLIDLLNKISKGKKVPKKIKYNWIYEWKYDESRGNYAYMKEKSCERFDSEWLTMNMLNEDIKIVEDEPKEEKKIPEKLGLINYCEDPATSLIHRKVDEIIDYLKSKGE